MGAFVHFIILFVFVLGFHLKAQDKSDRYKPKWLVKEVPEQNDAYLFERAYGDGKSLDEARQHCFINLITKLEHERGIVVSSKFRGSSHLTRESYSKTKDFSMECEENGKKITLISRVVDEYWQRNRQGEYGCFVLYSIANLANSQLPEDYVNVSACYGFDALWRSAIVPGWGQFHKGANLKGGLILGGCAALIAGIIFTENQHSDYVRKIVQTHSVNLKRDYATKRDHFATGRNICIGACAALYIYNLVDAIAAPGARRVVVNSKNRRYAVAPVILPKSSIGFATRITF